MKFYGGNSAPASHSEISDNLRVLCHFPPLGLRNRLLRHNWYVPFSNYTAPSR
jgi:hypothetical protein